MLNLLKKTVAKSTSRICLVLNHAENHTHTRTHTGSNSKGRTDFYPAFWKKLFSSSHLCIGKHPWVKPNISLAFQTKGVQGCRLSSVPYMTLSCKVPPNLIFKGEKAAEHFRGNDTLTNSQNNRELSTKKTEEKKTSNEKWSKLLWR